MYATNLSHRVLSTEILFQIYERSASITWFATFRLRTVLLVSTAPDNMIYQTCWTKARWWLPTTCTIIVNQDIW